MGNNKATVKQPGSATAWLDLETVIRRLHASDLRVGVQASDAGIQVWISDRLHRVREERLFDRSRSVVERRLRLRMAKFPYAPPQKRILLF